MIAKHETGGPCEILRVSGRVDFESALDFEQQVNAMLQHGGERFIIELSEVELLSSAGLRVLLSTAKRVTHRNAELALAAPSQVVRQVFEISHFNLLFKIFPSIEAAIAGLKGNVPASESPTETNGTVPDDERTDPAPSEKPAVVAAQPARRPSSPPVTAQGGPTVELKASPAGTGEQPRGNVQAPPSPSPPPIPVSNPPAGARQEQSLTREPVRPNTQPGAQETKSPAVHHPPLPSPDVPPPLPTSIETTPMPVPAVPVPPVPKAGPPQARPVASNPQSAPRVERMTPGPGVARNERPSAATTVRPSAEPPSLSGAETAVPVPPRPPQPPSARKPVQAPSRADASFPARLELRAEGNSYPCEDGDVIGSMGRLGSAYFSQIPGLAPRHLLIGKLEGRWFVFTPQNVQHPFSFDGHSLIAGERKFLQYAEHQMEFNGRVFGLRLVPEEKKPGFFSRIFGKK